MARATTRGMEMLQSQIEKLERADIRQIVEAGADAAVKIMRDATEEKHHYSSNRDMLNSIRKAEYREYAWGGSQMVYPQGTDRNGNRNAMKAFVTNYGRRGEKHPHSADGFITRKSSAIDQAVTKAMQETYDRIVSGIVK